MVYFIEIEIHIRREQSNDSFCYIDHYLYDGDKRNVEVAEMALYDCFAIRDNRTESITVRVFENTQYRPTEDGLTHVSSYPVYEYTHVPKH